MNKNQYKFTGDDEAYTYPYLIKPLIPFIEKFKIANGIKTKKDLTIWCPFDVKENIVYKDIQLHRSCYVDIFEKEGYSVEVSHIATGQDFFEYEPEKWNIIISNPPFKNKRKFFERALEFNKPFCMLNTAAWLNDSGIYNVFHNKQLQLLMPDKRAEFFGKRQYLKNRPSFKSVYYCCDFLQNSDIQWFKLDKKEKNF